MQITGKAKSIGSTQEVSASFKKRELVVTTDEQYPQHILIEFVQDKCSLLDNLKAGQNVTVSINIRGREWANPQGEVKYFNSIHGWRVEAVNGIQSNEVPGQSFEPTTNFKEEEHDDLPFN